MKNELIDIQYSRGKMFPQFHISQHGLLLHFLQIHPSYYQLISEKIFQQKKNPSDLDSPFEIHLGLGKFDLIYSTFVNRLFNFDAIENHSLLSSKDCCNIIDANHVFGYIWENKETPIDLNQVVLDHPFVFYSFFKINPIISQQYGLLSELLIQKYLYNLYRDHYLTKDVLTNYMLFNLGGHEAIIISNAPKLETLFLNLLHLRSIRERDIPGFRLKDNPIFICSNSIPAIRMEAVDIHNKQSLLFIDNDNPYKMHIQVNLSCTKPHDFKTTQQIEEIIKSTLPDKCFKNLNISQGLFNVAFNIGPRTPINNYFNMMYSLGQLNASDHSDHNNPIRNIETRFTITPQDIPNHSIDYTTNNIPVDGFDFMNEGQSFWGRKYPLIRQRFFNLGHVLGNKGLDSIQSSNFNDLLRSTLQYRDDGKKDKLKKHANHAGEKILSDLYNAYEFALNQRMVHSNPAIFDVSDRCFSNRGGIQRILIAADVLCKSTFESAWKNIDPKMTDTWTGFTTFGRNHDYTCTKLADIVNFPYQSIFDVGSWWGIFHEIGHGVFGRYEREYKADKRTYTEKRILPLNALSENDQRNIDYLVEEIFSDVFAMIYCFNCDTEKHSNLFWKHHFRINGLEVFQSKNMLETVFIRSFISTLYVLDNKRVKKHIVQNRLKLTPDIKQMIITEMTRHIDLIIHFIPDQEVKHFIRENLDLSELVTKIDYYDILYLLAHTILAYHENSPGMFPIKIFRNILIKLCNGDINIPFNDISNIIYALAKGRTSDNAKVREMFNNNVYRANITALLFLWDRAMINSPDRQKITYRK